MDHLNKDTLERMFVNPVYAVTFQDYLFDTHELEGAKEDWAAKNTQLIAEMGVAYWLYELLAALSTPPKDSPTYKVISPYRVVVFSNRLQGDHDPLITREQWVTANKNMMAEVGTDKWLWLLLEVLETGGPA